ncbi:2-keto-4-pentenoate hydratase [Ruicaihuangia caeni]|uniref:2-keto-4-pentenoate hydratase n=1 Tax=Ruicaihuangia caeni TaxID=3042517 RepID=A0AAW6T732_9MICO|nr:2-keto-4-pentenoate hydratase [Klugiella sp. YN-L-19]MDI2099039.1 2-keto-4-pentenoate hydratase [Klugiella sp. YN-L-19]
MTASTDHARLGDALLAAYDSKQPIAPITSTVEGLQVADAYAIQQHQVAAWTASGRTIRGRKVGLTSLAMQRQLGVDQPDYGVLLDDMFHLDSMPIEASRFISPKVEPEISFMLKKPLAGPGVTVAEAIQAVDYAIASIEIIDSRIADWKITLVDTIADNASSGGVVLGTRPVELRDIDLFTTGCVLTKNGAVVDTGAGGAVLGSPIGSLVWLANTLGQLGVSLEAGEVVMPGSVCAAVAVSAGDTVTAHFGALGPVTARFV